MESKTFYKNHREPSMMKAALLTAAVLLLTAACSLSIGPLAAGETVETGTDNPPPSVAPTAVQQGNPAVENPAPAPPLSGDLIQPANLAYLGAFRLPDDGDRPRTFEYGGNAMTFRPGADPENDDFPGTLFITGHDRLAYGELTDGSQVAEVSIPAPVQSRDIEELNTAAFVQGFRDVAGGHFNGLDEIPRIALAYLDAPATGPLLHIGWGQHMPPETPPATHAWVSADLSAPDFQGEWFIDEQDFNAVNGYMFEIPSDWAAAHTGGMPLATGRFRDGGWSGMGPALFAYQPWVDEQGSPAAPGSRLPAVTLLRYENSATNEEIVRCMEGYQHPDEWEGGAFLTTGGGKSAVIFTGTKSVGEKYWYGWANPAGPDKACVETELAGQFTLCRLADGRPCPPADLTGCEGHNDTRGWWSTSWEARMIFYDPADLARVAAGEMEAWQPQPYASLSLEPVLFHNPSGVEPDMLGQGVQRRFRIGETAFDRANGLVYVLELYADGAKPVVHVWRLAQD